MAWEPQPPRGQIVGPQRVGQEADACAVHQRVAHEPEVERRDQPADLLGAASLLLLVGVCWSEAPALFGHEPRRSLGRAGVLAFGGGLLTSCVAMLVLGQQGVPRRYVTYVPQFQTLHQSVGLAGLVAAVGLVLVVVALAVRKRPAP